MKRLFWGSLVFLTLAILAPEAKASKTILGAQVSGPAGLPGCECPAFFQIPDCACILRE